MSMYKEFNNEVPVFVCLSNYDFLSQNIRFLRTLHITTFRLKEIFICIFVSKKMHFRVLEFFLNVMFLLIRYYLYLLKRLMSVGQYGHNESYQLSMNI